MFKEYLNKLSSLDKNTKPLWGKMSAQHMVEHLILAIKMSNGKLLFECINPEEKLPKLKRFLMSDRPMPKGFVNPVIGSDIFPLNSSSLEEAINKLKREVEDYHHFFKDNPNATPLNVTFGELNKSEWDQFHKKHFTHHLKQFGLI